MKQKNVKLQPAKALANITLKLAAASTDIACAYIYHQPQMPDELKKMKKS